MLKKSVQNPIAMLGTIGGTVFLVYVLFKCIVAPFAKFGFRKSMLENLYYGRTKRSSLFQFTITPSEEKVKIPEVVAHASFGSDDKNLRETNPV